MKFSAKKAENGDCNAYFSVLKNQRYLIRQLMRISLIAIAITFTSLNLLFAFRTSAQSISSTKVVIGLENEGVLSAIEKIEKQTPFRFMYRNNDLKGLKDFNIPLKTRTVEEFLNLLLSSDRFNIKQLNNKIQISLITPVLSAEKIADKIGGIVLDEQGNPLPGVTVRVKKGKVIQEASTATDLNGHFGLTISSSSNEMVLIFSYLGYQTQEVALGAEKSVRVVMKPSAGSLNEVQVIGYGTTTRKLNTGAVSSITAEDIGKQTVGNPIQALAGRIAGMTVVQNNGLPGSNTNVQIRGNNTLGANGLSGAIPLYIVDGVPFTNFNGGIPFSDNLNSFGVTGAAGGISPFSVINPQDIERIDVLKDADATAIYGARGANGVVLITTKQGKAGKSQLTANVYHGAGRVANKVEMLNTAQYLELRREAFVNDGVTPNATNAPDLLTWDQNAYTDWQDLLIGGTAKVTDAQLNYSGGTERVRFFTSLNYRKEGTVFPGDMGIDRLTGRLNLQTKSANNKFTTAFSVSYGGDKTNLITSDVSSALSLPPNYPLYNANGTLYWGANFTNPYANLLKGYESTNSNFIANGDLKYNLLKGLNLKTNLGYSRTNLVQNSANPLSSQNPASTGISNSAVFANSVSSNYIIEPQLDYLKTFKKSTFSALVGASFQQNVSDATRINASNYAFEALLKTVNGAGTVTSTNNYSLYKYGSMFGRVNYDYANKYIVNLTFRRDASSRFGTNHSFANFGAIGAAWIFSDESFVKNNLNFLSFGKLRASYGTTGNDQLPNYSYLSTFSTGATYQNLASLALNKLPNPDLKWETTKKLEFGIDLGFFKDRLTFKADAYWHRSNNLLTYASPSLQTGFNSINTNLGALVQNRGLEFELNSTNINGKDFKWNSSFNISFQNNELLRFDNQSTAFYASSFFVGYPVSLTRLYQYNGIDPATGAILYQDLDGATGLNFNTDRYIAPIGTPFFGGLNNTFTYKGFSLDVFMQFNHGMGTINNVYGTRIGSLNNQNTSVLSRWRKAGDTNTLFPGASANAGGAIYSTYNSFGQSSFFYGDNSWLKLRSANLSYTLPDLWTKNIKLSKARVYVQGQNLLTFAKNDNLLDPESGNSMPPLRTIVFGVNLTL